MTLHEGSFYFIKEMTFERLVMYEAFSVCGLQTSSVQMFTNFFQIFFFTK